MASITYIQYNISDKQLIPQTACACYLSCRPTSYEAQSLCSHSFAPWNLYLASNFFSRRVCCLRYFFGVSAVYCLDINSSSKKKIRSSSGSSCIALLVSEFIGYAIPISTYICLTDNLAFYVAAKRIRFFFEALHLRCSCFKHWCRSFMSESFIIFDDERSNDPSNVSTEDAFKVGTSRSARRRKT